MVWKVCWSHGSACLYPSHAAYDLVKGGDQPYPGVGVRIICGVPTDPVCTDSAVKPNIGNGLEVEYINCLNASDAPGPGLPAKYCYIHGPRLECWLFTSPKDKTAIIRCLEIKTFG
ncbi:hypothetical protein WDU94_010853 [Cyamophila willieti]